MTIKIRPAPPLLTLSVAALALDRRVFMWAFPPCCELRVGSYAKSREPKGWTDRNLGSRATEHSLENSRPSIVDLVGSCGEGRAWPFISPAPDLGSKRATPGTRPLLKVQTHLDPSLLQTFLPSLHVLRRQASPLCRAHPNPQPKSRKFTIFFSHPCVHPCRHGLPPGPRGSRQLPLPSERTVLPQNQSMHEICSTSPPHLM